MFYSQFILAKKGPLGTIWIAAHLERKLRKNQVAETDIGVSVDSILSPDVPIALRLSSHLLLGVVRIYNKQVNYLFDDCSEALLKVKQAFRSTAVDLPPEQSKAPYHSITLPETFDLDDFELPDNDIYQGNYVDHHVSSREQITLQDTMEGVAFSTTQFGLDERFGDGDTSGLDLEEELLLGKIDASAHAGASTDLQASDQTMAAPKEDDHHEEMTTNLVPMIDEVGEHVDLMDDAQAPRTPGLVEEPNLCNVQETSACDDHFESNNHQSSEFAVKENLNTIFGETDTHCGDKHVDDWSLPNDTNSHAVVQMPSENGYHSGEMDIKQLKPQEISSATEVAVEQMAPDHAPASGPTSLISNHVTEAFPVPDLADKVVDASYIPCWEKNAEVAVDHEKTFIFSGNESLEDHGGLDGSSPKIVGYDISGAASTCQQDSEVVSGDYHTSASTKISHNLESAVILEKSRSPSNALDVDVDFQGQTCQEPKESKDLSFDVNEQITGAEFPVLRPCNASLDQPALSNPKGDRSVDPNLFNENTTQGSVGTSGREETPHSEKFAGADNMIGCASDEGIHAAIGKPTDEVDYRILRDIPTENVNDSTGPDLPAPEKLLSVTEIADDLPRNLIMESTPGGLVRNDDGDAGSSVVSGKKRSYAESTLTEQSLNSVESSRIVRSKRTVEFIPDDDDLLSSILVGRKSSVLKVKSTPPPWEMTSVKRSYTPRASANKRKVLMDDNMVLHGDTIRQQLMNTEDIRRVRKKAPCTHSEISKIRNQFLEDEIFMEPVSTSGSIELTSLHHQAYDLSGLQVSVDDVNCASLETATGMKLDTKDGDSCRNLITEDVVDSSVVNFMKESEKEGTNDLPIVAENGEGERAEAPSVDESKLDEDPSVSLDGNITTSQMKPTTDVEPSSSLLELPEEVTETEIDGRSNSIAEVITDLPGADESSLPADQISGDRGDISADVYQVANIDDNSGVMVHTADNIETREANASLQIDATDIPHDQQVVEVSLEIGATGGEMVEGDDMAGKDCDLAAAVEDEPQTGYEVLLTAAQGDATVKTAPDAENRETKYDSHSLDDKKIEQSMMDYSIAGEGDRIVEDFLMDNEERPREEVVNLMTTTDDAETSVPYDHDAINYSTAEYETEFLNVDDDDDDELAEPTDDNIPNEDVRLIENSGWSSRTRAVANYLQTLFVKQDRNDKPALSMDNLLVGKTRKEASRMFFEALVLKTRDYVHVEQENPFQNIAIKPRSKLMKSDF